MTPTPEAIAREAALERVTRWLHHESCGLLPSFEWPGPGVCACKATVAALISEAIRSAVQAETEERLTLARHVVEFLDDLDASDNPCLDASNPQAAAFHMLRAEAIRSRGDK